MVMAIDGQSKSTIHAAVQAGTIVQTRAAVLMDTPEGMKAELEGDFSSGWLCIRILVRIHCGDISKDKLLVLGNVLKEIYEAKLQWRFPDRPCTVEFFVPDDPDELTEYLLSFWQNATTVPSDRQYRRHLTLNP